MLELEVFLVEGFVRDLNDLLIWWDINNRVFYRIFDFGNDKIEMCKEKKVNMDFCYSAELVFIFLVMGVIF